MFKLTVFLLTFSLACAQMVCNDECSKILGSTNQERAKVGKPALCINSQLMMAAQEQANYQARINKMTHTGEGGSSAGDRVTRSGYQWSACAENVAEGQATPHGVMLGWMNSPGHRKNILSDNTEMGLAHVGEFWSQVFGTPKRGAGGCNVATVGGQLGQMEGTQPDIGPRCGTGTLCSSILSVVNNQRAMAGLPPVCISPKLMAAAQKVVTNRNDYRSLVEDTGFGAKGVGLAMQSIRSSAGPPTDTDILTMFRQGYRGSSSDGDYSRAGIASDARRENWFIVLAGTYTPDLDQCEGAGASLSVSAPAPPVSLGVGASAPAVSCGVYRTACECLGACGWSTGSGQCVAGGLTDCTECPTKPECKVGVPAPAPVVKALPPATLPTALPPATLPATGSSCSQHLTPCQCVGACGWSSTSNQCFPATASTFTDCSECPSQPRCLTETSASSGKASPTPRGRL